MAAVARRQARAAQVDDELADAEAVGVADLGDARRAVVAVADAAVDVDARGGDDAGRQRQRQRREDQPARAPRR